MGCAQFPRNQGNGNVEIPIIIETSPEGRANIPFKKNEAEIRPCLHNMKHDNTRTAERLNQACKSSYKPPQGEIIQGCTCLAKVGGQLQALSQRLDHIENKIGGDIEAIFEILRSCREALKQKGQDMDETVI